MTPANPPTDLARAEAEQKAEYVAVRKRLDHACVETKTHVLATLANHDLLVPGHVRVEGRVKEWESLWPKVEDGRHPRWDLVPDLLGLKVVTKSSIEARLAKGAIESLTEKPTVARPWYSGIGRSRGYSAIHGHIALDFLEPIPAPLQTLGAEVIVFTELQNSWDLATHDDFYKSPKGVPASIRERLFRIAGAIDLIDDEMREILEQLDSKRAEIAHQISIEANSHIDEVSLLALSRTRWHRRFRDIATSAEGLGFRRSDWQELARLGPEVDAFIWACTQLGLKWTSDLQPYVDITASGKWDDQLAEVCSIYMSGLEEGKKGRLFNRPLTIILMVMMFEEPSLSGPFFIKPVLLALRSVRSAPLRNGAATRHRLRLED